MTDRPHAKLAERERRIGEALRSADDVHADAAFRERLKREFVSGTIAERAPARGKPRSRRSPRGWWVLVPAAAGVLLFALLLPRPAPTWLVQDVHGQGRVEIDGRTLAADEPSLVARALGSGGRVRIPEGVSLDVRLGDRLILALDEGADMTVPGLPERGRRGLLIGKLHDGELRIKTGPGFPGTELRVLTAEGTTEIVGTVVSVYKGDGYTCVCVLEGTARVGADEARLEEVPQGMLKVMFGHGRPPIVAEISAQHEADLREFNERYHDLFSMPE